MSILDKIAESFMGFFRALTPLSYQEQEEKYLSQATSLAELEQRQREWDRQRQSLFASRPLQ